MYIVITNNMWNRGGAKLILPPEPQLQQRHYIFIITYLPSFFGDPLLASCWYPIFLLVLKNLNTKQYIYFSTPAPKVQK